MSGPVLAIFLTLFVHVVAFFLLFMLAGEAIMDTFRMRPEDSDDDGGLPPSDDPVARPDPGGGGLPLPDAAQSPTRLREPGRIARKPARRPEHDPQRTPQRV